jgi:hypothetical protein
LTPEYHTWGRVDYYDLNNEPCEKRDSKSCVVTVRRGLHAICQTFTFPDDAEGLEKLTGSLEIAMRLSEDSTLRHVRETLGIKEPRE